MNRPRDNNKKYSKRPEVMKFSVSVLAPLLGASFLLQNLVLCSATITYARNMTRRPSLPWESVRLFTEWFNDEKGGYSVKSDYPIISLQCRGRYCDEKQFQNEVLPVLKLLTREGMWTPFISSGSHPKLVRCPPNTVVNRFQCKGSYCSSIRLHCGLLPPRLITRYLVPWTSKWFSEEEGSSVRCPDGHVLTGLGCRARNCDNIMMVCFPISLI